MTHSLKVSFAGIAFAIALLFGATSAFAAVTVQDIGTLFDGKTSTNVDAGDEFTVLFTADATSGDEIEYVRTRVEDQDGQVIFNRCTNVGRKTGNDVEIEVEASTPSDTPQGNLDVLIDVFGMGGVAQVDGCSGSSLDGETFEDRVRVGDNTQDAQSNNVGNSSMSALQAMIAQLTAAITALTNGGGTSTGSTNTAKCEAIKPYLSAPANTYSAVGVQLQSALLLDDPYSIPALAAGSTVKQGYRGPQTESALATYKTKYGCK